MNRKIIYLIIVTVTIMVSCKTSKKANCDAYGRHQNSERVEKISK